MVAVELERDRLGQIDAFKRKARLDRQVLNFYCIAGDADFVMIVGAKDIADNEVFIHRFFFSDKKSESSARRLSSRPRRRLWSSPSDYSKAVIRSRAQKQKHGLEAAGPL